MAAKSPPLYLASGGSTAEDDRRAHLAVFGGRGGIVAANDLLVTQNGTPNMSVNVDTGQVVIPGTQGTYAGVYFCENQGAVNIALAAADATNARYDLIVARVRDNQYGGGIDTFAIEAVTGVPAAVPLEPAIPANSWVLARVTVNPAPDNTIITADILDRRATGTGQFGRASALGGTIPCTSTTRPTGIAGAQIFELDTGKFLIHSGSAWVEIADVGGYDLYTPTLSGTGGAGTTLGNGTISGFFQRDGGGNIHILGALTFGTTTAFGTNTSILVSLPAGISAPNVTNLFQHGTGFLNDFGVATCIGHPYIDPNTNLLRLAAVAYNGASAGIAYSTLGLVTASVPFTWGNQDFATWSITLRGA
ncbi:MAG: hypothetical protein ACKV2O_14720 [Acidimicrobiales bacterium]